jgi:hypothetical protein
LKIDPDFDQNAYVRRLQLLREIVSGENQVDFAERLGIDVKRWNNYERGYPLPREIAFLLRKMFDVCPGWIWFGLEGNMPSHLREKIKAAEALEKERRAAKRQLDKAAERLKAVDSRRKKAIHPRGSPKA